MTDDVKAAVERFHTWEFDGLDARDHATLLAHLDGEPARTAAAVAAAVENFALEVDHERDERLARAEKAEGHAEDSRQFFIKERELRLAAEAERDRLAGDALTALAGAGVATPLEGYAAAPFLLKGDIGRLAAERDALRAQVAELELDRDDTAAELFHAYQRNEALEIEAQSLRAQVEAARTYARQALDYGEDCDATDLLAAMDGAKP